MSLPATPEVVRRVGSAPQSLPGLRDLDLLRVGEMRLDAERERERVRVFVRDGVRDLERERDGDVVGSLTPRNGLTVREREAVAPGERVFAGDRTLSSGVLSLIFDRVPMPHSSEVAVK